MSGPVVPQNNGERELFRGIPLPDKTPKRPSIERSATFTVKAEKKTDQTLDSLVDAVLASSKYKPQSGEEVGQTISAADDNIESEVVQFSDENPGHALVVESTYDKTMSVSNDENVNLGTYLARPVEIAAFNWAVNSTLGISFNPWSLWAANRWVRAKLANYGLLRCKLHVKFLINGTPFHYGKLLAAYDPLHLDSRVGTTAPFSELELVHNSQKPHVYLDPQNAQGASMVLPYFWYNNYFDLARNELNRAGAIDLGSFGNLLSASDSENAVTVSVYAWAEDVCLAMPTSQYLPQSGMTKTNKLNSDDEYGKGIISNPASTVAKAAGMLEKVPVIGPYARATEIVAGGVGSLAALFGFSRPNILSDRQTYSPEHLGVLANTNAADSSVKLSLDAKQELTIDSRTVGLDGEDQMSAASIIERESYLTNFTWAETATPNTFLWNTRVGPNNQVRSGTRIAMTPACLWSQHWCNWHGTVKYRFQIVKSRHHRGRLLFRWDPNHVDATVEPNAVYSRIVDIEQEDDFEIEIGWGQADPFKQVQHITAPDIPHSSNKITTTQVDYYNGVLDVTVLNRLVSPDGSSPVQILVSVSMCPDAKFGAPIGNVIANLTPFLPQSGFVPQSGMVSAHQPTGASAMSSIGSPGKGPDPLYSVCFGESVTSLRELLKRYYYTRSIARPVVAQDFIAHNRFVAAALPYTGGADNSGLDLLRGSSTNRATVATNGPIQIWNLAFAGWRGGIRHKYVISDDSIAGPVRATRLFGPIRSYGYTTSTIANNTSVGDYTKWLSSANAIDGWNGAYVTDGKFRKTVEVEIPFYTRRRFHNSRVFRATTLPGDGIDISDITASGTSRGFMEDYVAVADDYTLFFFTGVPLLYIDYVDATTTANASSRVARTATGPRSPPSQVAPLAPPVDDPPTDVPLP